MSKCPVCSSILAELLTSTYCPTCEAKEARLPTEVPAPAFARPGLWQIVTDDPRLWQMEADPDFTISISTDKSRKPDSDVNPLPTIGNP